MVLQRFGYCWLLAAISFLQLTYPVRAQNELDLIKSSNPGLVDALRSGHEDVALSEILKLNDASRQEVLTYVHGQGGLSGAGANEGSTGAPSGSGGAALANFNELMRLIESTVTPDTWANGGGSSTMMPFRGGVRIDASGVIERIESGKKDLATNSLRLPRGSQVAATPVDLNLNQLGAWQSPSRLRWISLHELDRQLASRKEHSQRANIAMELLGGIYRIDYIAFDSKTSEWLIGGPAGDIVETKQGDLVNRETRLPPVLLEDLLTVGPHILNQRGELGCSIDPVQERLVAAYKLASDPSAGRMLRNDPDEWVDQWKSKLGKQRAIIVGLRADSPTGYALLIADAHMKRLALGLEPLPTKLKSYWTETDLCGVKNPQSMVRWWFSLSNSRILNDPDRHIYRFEGSNVQVLSEAQLLNSKGERVVATSPDMAADAYARNFTSQFNELQSKYPIYGRLRHVFDLAVALELVRTEIAHGAGKPFVMLSDIDLQPRLPVAPTEIDSVASHRKRSDGMVQAIVSGGVSIEVGSTKQRVRKHITEFSEIELNPSIGEALGTQPERLETPFWR